MLNEHTGIPCVCACALPCAYVRTCARAVCVRACVSPFDRSASAFFAEVRRRHAVKASERTPWHCAGGLCVRAAAARASQVPCTVRSTTAPGGTAV